MWLRGTPETTPLGQRFSAFLRFSGGAPANQSVAAGKVTVFKRIEGSSKCQPWPHVIEMHSVVFVLVAAVARNWRVTGLTASQALPYKATTAPRRRGVSPGASHLIAGCASATCQARARELSLPRLKTHHLCSGRWRMACSAGCAARVSFGPAYWPTPCGWRSGNSGRGAICCDAQIVVANQGSQDNNCEMVPSSWKPMPRFFGRLS